MSSIRLPERSEHGGALHGWGRGLVAASRQVPREALRFLGGDRRHRRAPLPGAQPGEMIVPVGAPEPSIRVLSYGPDAFEERTLGGPDELQDVVTRPGRITWIDVEGFGCRATLERIGSVLGVHGLAMADIVNVPQRSKAELYDDRLLVIMMMARLTEQGAIELEQLSLVLGPGWVATFQEQPGDVFDPVRARIRSDAARIRRMGADYLAYALIDALIDGYFPVVEAIGGVVDALEEEVLERPSHSTLARIHATRSLLATLHRTQWRQRDAIALMLRDEQHPFSETVRIYLRDAHDHAFQTVDAIESFREVVVGLMELHLSSANNRLNEVMKTLTVVATIFIPLTFLSGVYGMNFDHMPELHLRWGYPAVWAVMALSAGGFLAWFRARGWLGGARGSRRD